MQGALNQKKITPILLSFIPTESIDFWYPKEIPHISNKSK